MNDEPKKKSLIMRTISSIRVEPIAFVYGLAVVFRSLANQQIIIDKICHNDMGHPVEFCAHLDSKDGFEKNLILGDATIFATKKELMGILPSTIMGMMVGVWCDMFQNGRRICLLIALTGHFTESILCMLNAIFFDASKYWLLPTGLPTNAMGNGALIACVSYIAANTREKDRAFRFILFDVFIFSGYGLGFLLGGICMGSPNQIISTPMRNYADNFLVSAILMFTAIVYAYFVVKELPKEESDVNGDIEMTEGSSTSQIVEKKKKIFSFDHFKEAWLTLTKKRPDNFHHTIWTLLVFLQIATLPILGADNIIYPLTQRLYNWDYVTYSRVTTFATLIKPTATLLIMPIIIKKLRPRDLQISMIGVVSSCLAWTSISSVISPYAYYLSIIGSCFMTVSGLGVKSFLSKLLPEDEVSKIFSIIMSLEALQPFIGSFIYSNIFRASIDHHPTLALQITVFLLAGALSIVCYIDNKQMMIEIIEEERDKRQVVTQDRRTSRRATIFTTDDLRKMSVMSLGTSPYK